MTEKLSRRQFGKLCAALAATGVLPWKAGPLNVDADEQDIARKGARERQQIERDSAQARIEDDEKGGEGKQPFAPYFCDRVSQAPARYTGPAPYLVLDDDDEIDAAKFETLISKYTLEGETND